MKDILPDELKDRVCDSNMEIDGISISFDIHDSSIQ